MPYALVIGGREADSGTVGVRKRIDGDLGSMSVDDFVVRLQAEVTEKAR